MSLKLKNRNVLPLDTETITILGLDIPLTDRLPFGAQVAILDLQNRRDEGELGNFEFLMRVFCLFTLRLPKNQQVKYDWLAQQNLEADEVAELTSGTMRLMQALNTPSADEGEGAGSPNAEPEATGESATSTP